MKKLFIFSFIFFSLLTTIEAKDKKEVKFSKCVDGDTAIVILDDDEIKLRFLAIDTPESVHPTIGEEEHGKEASEYTCTELKYAEKIEIEYDNNSDKLDKYSRHLVWVFVDGELLQGKLIEKGLAEVAYLYDDYKYTAILEKKQLIAQTKKIGIWNDNVDYEKIILGCIIILIIIIVCIFNKKFRLKTTNKIKIQVKKRLKKLLKNQN